MIVVIANSKGGSGKTATALNLLRRIRFDAIVDADPHKGLSDVVSLSDDSERVNVIHVKRPEQLADVIKKNDRILIDCGGLDSGLTRTALANADLIITPCNDDTTEQFGLQRFSEFLSQVDSKAIAHILISRVHYRRAKFEAMQQIESSRDNLCLLPIVIPALASVDEATSKARATSKTLHADRFDELALMIKEKLELW